MKRLDVFCFMLIYFPVKHEVSDILKANLKKGNLLNFEAFQV